MQLSKNFPLDDMLESPLARRYNVKEQFTPPQEIINNLKELCEKVLQPIRDKVKAPIIITSGYRCPRVNKLAKGSETSQHMKGEGVDIYCTKISNKNLYNIIVKMMKENNLPVDQLIWEYGTKDNPAWVHVSYTSSRQPRKQIFSIGI